nr:DUF5694 domain-containing protein [Hymenobacter arizonensis]
MKRSVAASCGYAPVSGRPPRKFCGDSPASEWYRRNLYIYSLAQKTMTPQDRKAFVLVGSGHAAMMKEFIEAGQQFRLKA